MAGEKFTGDEGHYHQDAINKAANPEAVAQSAAEAVAEDPAALSEVRFSELSEKEQILINSQNANSRSGKLYQNYDFVSNGDLAKVRGGETAAATEVSAEAEPSKQPTFGALSEKAQTYLSTQRANKQSGPGPFNSWTDLNDEALQLLRDGGFGDEVDALTGVETKKEEASPKKPESTERDPIADFYERLKSVKSFDELYGVLGRNNYVFETENGDQTWASQDMVALISSVEKGEQNIDVVPNSWDEIKDTVRRLLAEKEQAAQTPPPLPDDIEQTPPPLPVEDEPVPPALPDEEITTEESTEETPEEVEILEDAESIVEATEAPKSLEELQQELVDAREKYFQEHRAYMDTRKASGILGKLKQTFGGIKPEAENELPALLNYAKDNYDDAMRAYGKANAAMWIENAAQRGPLPEGFEVGAKAHAFREVFKREYDLQQQAKAETYPPAEKNLFVKSVDWWAKRKPVTKILITAGLIGFGGMPGAGIAAGLTGMSFAAFGGAAFEKISKVAKLDKLRDQDLDTVWTQLVTEHPDTAEEFSKTDAEARRVMGEDAARRRMREYKRTAVMIATGVLGLVSVNVLKDVFSGIGATEGAKGMSMPDAGAGGVAETAATGATEAATTAASETVVTQATEAVTTAAPEQIVATPIAEVASALPATEVQSSWFNTLHNTPYNPESVLDQAKMTVIQKLSDAGIMGSSGGSAVPSPIVDRAIQGVFGADNVSGWQSAAETVSNSAVLDQIKNLQIQALKNPSQASMIEAQIRAFFNR